MKFSLKCCKVIAFLLASCFLLAEIPARLGVRADADEGVGASVSAPQGADAASSSEKYYDRYVTDGLLGLYTAFSEQDFDLASGVWYNKIPVYGNAVLRGTEYFVARDLGFGYSMGLDTWKADATRVGISLPEAFASLPTFYTEVFATVEGITDENGDRLVNSYSPAVKDESGTVVTPAIGVPYGYYKSFCAAFRFELISTLFFCSLDDKKDSASLGHRWYLYNGGYPGAYPKEDVSEYFRGDPSNYEVAWRTAGPEDVPTPAQLRVSKQTSGGVVTYGYAYGTGQSQTLTITEARRKTLLSTSGKDASGLFSLLNGIPSTVYAVRVYNRVLHTDEVLQNSFIDKAAYYQLPLDAYDALSASEKRSLHAAFEKVGFSETKEYVYALFEYCTLRDRASLISRLLTFEECRPIMYGNGGYRVLFTVDKALYEFLVLNGMDVRFGGLVARAKDVLRNEDLTLENEYAHIVQVGGRGGSEQYFDPVRMGKYCFSVAITADKEENYAQSMRVRGYVTVKAFGEDAVTVYTDAFSEAMPTGEGSIASLTDYFVNRYEGDTARVCEYINSAVLRRVLSSCEIPVRSIPEMTFSFYVDAKRGSNKNDGKTPTTAFLTAKAAFDAAKACLAQPGKKAVEIYFSEGTHRVTEPLTLSGDEILASEYSLRIVGAGEETVITSQKTVDISDYEYDPKTDAVYFRLPGAEGSYPNIRALYGDGDLLRLAHKGDSEDVAIVQGFRVIDNAGKAITPLGANDWQLSDADKAKAKYGVFTLPETLFTGDLKEYAGTELHVGVIWTSHILHIHHVEKATRGMVDVYVPYEVCPKLNPAHNFTDRGVWLENAKVLLNDNEDTYYYDRETGIVYYKEGALAIDDYDEISYATAENIFILTDVSNVSISDLTMTGIDSRYIVPEATAALGQAAGLTLYYEGTGNTVSVRFMDSAAVYGSNVKNLHIARVAVKETLGAGVVLEGIVDGVDILSSSFIDLGEAAIRLGDNAYRANSYVRGATVADNYVRKIGTLYKAAVGIQLLTAADCRLIGNTVIDVPYSAFSVGWIWATVGTSAEDIVKGAVFCTYNTEIAYNYVTDFMTCMGDGGAFYLLGGNVARALSDDTPYNFMHHNYVNVSPESGKHAGYAIEGARHIMCYYHDNSSSNWHDYENVLINDTKSGDIFYAAFHQSTKDCEAQNNRQTNNYYIGFNSLYDAYRGNKYMLSVNTEYGIRASDYVYKDTTALVRGISFLDTAYAFSSKPSPADAGERVAALFAASGSSLYREGRRSGLAWTAPPLARELLCESNKVTAEMLLPAVTVLSASHIAVKGGVVAVPVYVQQKTGVGGSFTIHVEKNVASLLSYESAEGITVQTAEGGLLVTLTTKPTAEVAVLTLTLRVADSLPVGKHTCLSLSAEGADPADVTITLLAQGDVTQDGVINRNDVLAVKQYVIKTQALTDVQLAYADMNADGKVDARDAMLILQLIQKEHAASR